MKYRGIEIDGTVFTGTQDVDAFLKERAIESYRSAVWCFDKEHSYETANRIDECAERLVNQFGMDWDEVEALAI